nr:hypothetical protein [Tanacetum cinerariifolium]
MSICFHLPDGVTSKRHRIILIEDLNGVSVALVARFWSNLLRYIMDFRLLWRPRQHRNNSRRRRHARVSRASFLTADPDAVTNSSDAVAMSFRQRHNIFKRHLHYPGLGILDRRPDRTGKPDRPDQTGRISVRDLLIFCETYHIPDEVHPQLPNPNQTIHEMPSGKIGVYTSATKVSHFEVLCRFYGFEPTTGLFRCFYVNSKNKGWMSFSKRPGSDVVCYTKPLYSLKNWNDRFFWVDAFACPASFPWNTSKGVHKDPFPKSSEFNAEHFATLVALPAPFHKYPKPFLCLVGISRYYTLDEDAYLKFLGDNDEGMDLLAFIRTPDPTKVRVAERQRAKDEPRLLESTVGRVVTLLRLLLLVLSASWKLVLTSFLMMRLVGTEEMLMFEKEEDCCCRCWRPFSSPKKLREDYGNLGGASTAGKSMFAVQSLFTGAMLDAEARGEPIPTLPFVTSSVSATPEREDRSPADSVPGLNLRTIGAPQRFVISSDSSHRSGTNIAEAEVDSIVTSSAPAISTVTTVAAAIDTDATTPRAPAAPFLFGVGSSSTGRTDSVPGGFFDVSGSDFLVGGIRTVVDPDSDLQIDYVPRWSATNEFGLDDSRIFREMLDKFASPKFFASVRGMDHDQLFTEFNVGAARQISLNVEVGMRAEYNIREKRKLRDVVDEQGELLKAKDGEIESLKAQLLLKEAEAAKAIRFRADVFKFESAEQSLWSEVTDLSASEKVREQEVADLNTQVTAVKLQNDNLVGQVHELEISSTWLQEKIAACEGFVSQVEKFQDEKLEEVNEKFNKLCADFAKMALHLEENFYPHLLTTISGRRWLLTHGMGLAIAKCLNSTEYLSALGAAISKAIEKGMQEGLSAGITHGAEGSQLADVVTYNPSAEADYLSALHHLQNVNFSLIAELKPNKDASVDTIMNLLRLDDVLAERVGLTESQPHVDQLMVPIYHSPDQRVVGASALSLSLEVSHSRVKRMRENIANHVSALRGVFVPLSEPLSAAALEGMEGTSGSTHDVAATLSTTFIFASTILPISTDDYEVAHTDSQGGASVGDETVTVDDMNLFVSNA